MKRIIHQVYGVFNDGIPLSDIPVFHNQVKLTKDFCESQNIEYKMWDYDMCEKLIDKYSQYRKLYNNFRQPIQKADFIRYLILYDEGGIYVDCDICPLDTIDDLFELNEFFVKWNNDKRQLPYNAVIGSIDHNELYEDIFKEIIDSVMEKDKMAIYDTWTGRYVFQTTGHFMLNRVLKKYKGVKKLDILKIHNKGGEIISDHCPLFEDFNASVWYNNGNNLHQK